MDNDDLYFNLPAGRRGRDAGISLALRNERQKWLADARLIVLKEFPLGWEGLGEAFQLPVIQKIGKPHVYQVWGGFTNSLIKLGHFAHTGQHDPCRKRTSHACDGKYLRRIA